MTGWIVAACCSGHESPDRVEAVAAALYACGGHLAGAEQQVRVDLLEWLPGVRIEQGHGGGKEAFLFPSGGGTAVTAVTQISEMAQEFGGVLQARAIHVVFSSLCWGMGWSRMPGVRMSCPCQQPSAREGRVRVCGIPSRHPSR